MLADQAVQCVSLSVLFLSPSIRLSFILWRDITQILKMNCCLSLLIYSLLLSLSVSLSLFLLHTLFLLVKTESILESENRLSVSAPLRSLLDKGIQSPLLLLHISAFLKSFTQPSTFFLFFFSFFFFLRGLFRGFSLFLVLVSCMISILLLFMSQG